MQPAGKASRPCTLPLAVTSAHDHARYDPGGRLLAQRTVSLGADRVRLWDGWGRLGHLADGGSLRDESYTPEGYGVAGHLTAGEEYEDFTRSPEGHAKGERADQPIFAPYGELIEGTLDTDQGFQMQEWHPEAAWLEGGLYQMRKRWYSAPQRRFLSRDPLLSRQVSSHAFVGSSPILALDPLGLEALLATENMLDLGLQDTIAALRIIAYYNSSKTGRAIDASAPDFGASGDFYVIFHSGLIPGEEGSIAWAPDCEVEVSLLNLRKAVDPAFWPSNDPHPAVLDGNSWLEEGFRTLAHERGHHTGGPGHRLDGNLDPDYNERLAQKENLLRRRSPR